MTTTEFTDKLSTLVGLTLPALNGKRGDSLIVSVDNKKIDFNRKNSKITIYFVRLKLAFDFFNTNINKRKLYTKDFTQFFGSKGCRETFFFQLMKHFDLAKVFGKGVRGNPYYLA